jgi:high-affinity Fe2+/Pb2+ permease
VSSSRPAKTIVGVLAALFAGVAAAEALRYINVGETINLVVAVAAAVVLILMVAVTWFVERRAKASDATRDG